MLPLYVEADLERDIRYGAVSSPVATFTCDEVVAFIKTFDHTITSDQALRIYVTMWGIYPQLPPVSDLTDEAKVRSHYF
jgi:hypothetical protein